MELYITEKNKFSNFQSSFDRMLNNIRNSECLDKETKLQLLEINNMIDQLSYSVEVINENFISKDNKTDDPQFELKLKNIENDNKVIRNLIPLALMYRMTLSP